MMISIGESPSDSLKKKKASRVQQQQQATRTMQSRSLVSHLGVMSASWPSADLFAFSGTWLAAKATETQRLKGCSILFIHCHPSHTHTENKTESGWTDPIDPQSICWTTLFQGTLSFVCGWNILQVTGNINNENESLAHSEWNTQKVLLPRGQDHVSPENEWMRVEHWMLMAVNALRQTCPLKVKRKQTWNTVYSPWRLNCFGLVAYTGEKKCLFVYV